jgi:hypothetical protein
MGFRDSPARVFLLDLNSMTALATLNLRRMISTQSRTAVDEPEQKHQQDKDEEREREHKAQRFFVVALDLGFEAEAFDEAGGGLVVVVLAGQPVCIESSILNPDRVEHPVAGTRCGFVVPARGAVEERVGLRIRIVAYALDAFGESLLVLVESV